MYTIYLTGGRWGATAHVQRAEHNFVDPVLSCHTLTQNLPCCSAAVLVPGYLALGLFFLSLPTCLIVRVCDYKYVSP